MGWLDTRYARVAIRPRESRSRLGQVTVAAGAPRVDPSLMFGVSIGYGVGMNPETLTKPTGRIHAVDALRGFAMVWMTAFHFCFDLNQFGHIQQDFYRDPFWTWQRSLIVGLFVLCAGLGQALAQAQGQSWPRFWRRWLQVLGCALLVTLASRVMFAQSFIYFGVLHALALMLLVARLTAHWGAYLWLCGALVLGLKAASADLLAWGPLSAHADLFNSPLLNWLGLITRKPITEDYVPLLPWLGVMWWGMAAGQWLIARGRLLPSAPPPSISGWLATLGRWSLSYYMLHQPLLIGALMALAWATA